MIAAPQLTGIQPNDGALIENDGALIEQGTTLETAPRSLVFRFDLGQRIDAQTSEAIGITRSDPDSQFDTADENTTADATPSTRNLPLHNPEPAVEPEPESKNRDALLTSGVEIMRPNQNSQLDWGTDEPSESSPDSVDEARPSLLDEAFLD